MNRKKKRRLPPPPLSVIDKLINCVLFSFLIVIPFIMFIFFITWKHEYVFSNPNVLACYETASMLWILVPFFAYIIISLGGVGLLWSFRKPIFGNKNIRYGRSTQYQEIYPLFGKQRRISKRPFPLKVKALIIGVVALFFTLALMIGAFGIYGRYELSDAVITKYNVFSKITRQYSLDNVTSYTFYAFYESGYRGPGNYPISVNIIIGNRNESSFSYGDFRDILAMKKLDERLENVPKNIKGIEKLPQVFRDHQLDSAEQAIIRDMFQA
jgi:hypothetical protein